MLIAGGFPQYWVLSRCVWLEARSQLYRAGQEGGVELTVLTRRPSGVHAAEPARSDDQEVIGIKVQP